MFQVSVELHFDAAHYLRGYRGKCESLHGHRYKVVAALQTSEQNDIGLAYDFTELKRNLGGVIARFDHVCLNDVPPFDRINPSSENIAEAIYNDMQARLSGAPVSLSGVEVWESPESSVTYSAG